MLREPERADERRWSEWMTRANDGDADAYGRLLIEIADALASFLRARFGAVNFVEDCVQECLLAVHRARASYDPGRPFRPWLFAIARHKTIDLLRRDDARTRNTLTLEQVHATAVTRDPGAGIDGARLLERLAPEQREAIVLTKLAGFSVAEAARRCGVSESAMKSRVHRAVRAVRQLLDREPLQ